MKSFFMLLGLISFMYAAQAQTQAPVDPSLIPDYGHLYPKSTPEEFALAAEATRMGCNEYREDQIRILPKSKGPKENVIETCQCMIRNLIPANDIHEMRVLNAMFRDHEPPPSVFENVEELGEVFDERPDYRDHAIRLIDRCKIDPKYDDNKAPADQELNEPMDYTTQSSNKKSVRPTKGE